MSKKLPKVLNDEERSLLLAAKDSWGQGLRYPRNVRDQCMIQLMLLSGLRSGEVCALRVEDLDLGGYSVRVVDGKGGRDRVVPLRDETIKLLRLWLKMRKRLGFDANNVFGAVKDGFVGNPMSGRNLYMVVRNAARQAGIVRGVSPHMLRHTAATWLSRKPGVSMRVVQELLGHSSLSTTMVYTHVTVEDVRDAVRSGD